MIIRRPISPNTRIALGFVGIVVLALCYSWLAHRSHAANPLDRTIPTWGQLWEGIQMSFLPNSSGDEIWVLQDTLATFGRLFAGLGLSVLLALVLGLAMGCFPPVEALLQPILAFLAQVPPTAMMAIFFVTVGINTEMYVSMVAFGIVPTMSRTVHLAAKSDVPDELVNKAFTLGATQTEVVWNVIFKHILPKIIDSVRLHVGPSMVFLIAAEFAVGQVGFGYRIRLQQRLVDMRVVYIYLGILGAAGLTLDVLLTRLRRWLCPWFKG